MQVATRLVFLAQSKQYRTWWLLRGIEFDAHILIVLVAREKLDSPIDNGLCCDPAIPEVDERLPGPK